ncbi:MAG: diacylglycerol kinase family protein [Chloroflexota bacterium]
MQATLIYNPQAGRNGADQIENFKGALREAGYDAVYKETNSEEDLDAALAGVEGLVISAGGDGTARAVMIRLLNRQNVHFTPLPMGTANNVCRTLGIEGDPLDILRRLRSPQACGFDVGHLEAPWGSDYFLEGAGLGFFAEVLAAYDPEKGKSVMRSLRSLAEISLNGFSRITQIEFPEKTIQGEFLLVEALNTKAVGPHLKFAPDADPTDGLLHVVCIRQDQRDTFLKYLSSLVAEDLYELGSVELFKVKELKIGWNGFPVHVDDVVLPRGFDYRRQEQSEKQVEDASPFTVRPFPDVEPGSTLHLRVLPQALSVWLPAREPE